MLREVGEGSTLPGEDLDQTRDLISPDEIFASARAFSLYGEDRFNHITITDIRLRVFYAYVARFVPDPEFDAKRNRWFAERVAAALRLVR